MGKQGGARSVPRRRLEARPGGRYDLRVVSATGRSRSSIAKFAGSRRARERTSPPPSLARFTGGSSLSSSSTYRAGLFAVRARARRSEPSMVPHLRAPVSDRDSSDLLLPARDENFRARPGAREPTARLPRDHSADETPTSSASALRPDADSDMPGVARQRTCESRARCGPLALPERKPSESGYDATGRCRGNCSVKSEPGRRARETFRDVSRDFRLSKSSTTIQALMSGARRARLCAARAAAAMRRASSFRKSSWAVAPPAEGSLLQNS